MGLEANNGAMPDFMPLVTNMMQNLLSKELLYPALQDLSTKVCLLLPSPLLTLKAIFTIHFIGFILVSRLAGSEQR